MTVDSLFANLGFFSILAIGAVGAVVVRVLGHEVGDRFMRHREKRHEEGELLVLSLLVIVFLIWAGPTIWQSTRFKRLEILCPQFCSISDERELQDHRDFGQKMLEIKSAISRLKSAAGPATEATRTAASGARPMAALDETFEVTNDGMTVSGISKAVCEQVAEALLKQGKTLRINASLAGSCDDASPNTIEVLR